MEPHPPQLPPAQPPNQNVLPPPAPAPASRQSHSGLGIASFVLSIISGMALFCVVLAAGVIESSTPGGMDESSPQAMVVGLFLFAFMGLALLAAGLGVGGLCQKNRRKIFAILGVAFSGAAIVLVMGLMIFGLMAG
ncbi:hypothetical protein M2103_001990 [Ereboglobus sp. PH5-5]|uniref:hypothetical protein n=1 Tax=unclassified Ereboglobus TaxID=2626932 RepID=UPI002404BCE8|nr:MULTISPECIES: hypothetical protein [unclassified Ereboglobus]MDF9827280.1 hypothetical protein [Ereboglobus sp. PH5-10]MDF9833757.1 hypothetical protein [Ereboglobus sp. PH5-5]